jgi:hypothetical protein
VRIPHRVGLAVAVVVGGLASAATVAAAPLSVELAVARAPGAEDCPDRDGLARVIERLVDTAGGAGRVRSGGDVRAEVGFSRAASIYQATLRLAGAKQGERTLTDTGPTCTALGRAVGITMALLLDDALPEPPLVAAIPPPPSAPVTREASSGGSSEGFVVLDAGAGFGLVGGPAPAAGLAFGVRLRRRAWLELDGHYVAPRATAFAGGEVDVSLVFARLRACGVLTGDGAALLVAVCGEGAGGALTGQGRGYATADGTARLPWGAAGGGLRGRRKLDGRWSLDLAADVLAPLRTSTFSVAGRGVAYRSTTPAVMLQLGVGVVLW